MHTSVLKYDSIRYLYLILFVRLTNAINTRGKQLVMRLNEVCDQKQNTLNEKKVALDQLSRLTDHCILFGTHALKKGSDMELLYSKKYIDVTNTCICICAHTHVWNVRTRARFIMKE